MENIFYSGNFPETQKKYSVEQLPVKSPLNYDQRKKVWEDKVGE